MAKKETAEEKLLKIIEATKQAKAGASAVHATAKVPKPAIGITFQQINAALIAAVVAGLIFFAYQINSGFALLGQDVSVPDGVAAAKDVPGVQVPQMKNLAYYLDQIALRNIFQPYEKKAADQGASSAEIGLQTKMSKYKLVGVAWLDVPESATAMLEDTGKHETRFLREGDKIEDVKVKAIYTDRVVFICANEEITIKL